MTLTSSSDLVSAIAQVSASNIKIQRAGALKAVKAARILPAADLERYPHRLNQHPPTEASYLLHTEDP